jgi:ribosome-associated protein
MASRRAADQIVADEQGKNAAWLDDEQPPRETRGEKKRRATQLERLGESLVDLAPSKLARVPMPDDLRTAVNEARRIKTNRGGYRRQVQFIGRIMRNLDAQPIADALEAMQGEDAPSARTFRAAEVWRARLIAEGDKALADLVTESPRADRTLLRQLLRQAQKERGTAKPPHATRALFRKLKALFDA